MPLAISLFSVIRGWVAPMPTAFLTALVSPSDLPSRLLVARGEQALLEGSLGSGRPELSWIGRLERCPTSKLLVDC